MAHPAGQSVLTFSAEDLLVYLCAHGAKHAWERLSWVVDVGGLIDRCRDLDWDAVNRLAAEEGVERVLLLGLILARDLTGAGLPVEIERSIALDPAVEKLASKVMEWYDMAHGQVARSLFLIRLQRGLRDKLRSGLRLLISPSIADWKFFPLPERWSAVYPLLRPLRLVVKLLRPE